MPWRSADSLQLLKGRWFSADLTRLRNHDLLNLFLGGLQLGFAMGFERRPPLVERDRLLERGVAAFELGDNLLEFSERFFKGEAGYVDGHGALLRRIFGQGKPVSAVQYDGKRLIAEHEIGLDKPRRTHHLDPRIASQ